MVDNEDEFTEEELPEGEFADDEFLGEDFELFEIDSEQFMGILQGLVDTVGLEGAVLCTSDGLPMASALKEGIEEDRIAAMSAAAITLGYKVAEEINSGEVQQVTVQSSNGYVIMHGIGEEAVLTAVAGEKVKLGFLMLEMQRARDRLAELILGSE